MGGAYVSYTETWLDSDTTLVLTPNSDLANFTAHEVTVNTSVVDLAGRFMDERARSVFYTVDNVPPTVLDVWPLDGATQVPVEARVRITFTEPVDYFSLSGSALQLTALSFPGCPVEGGVTTTYTLLGGEREVVLTPTTALSANCLYQLTVQSVLDKSGNAMAAPVSTSFWTPDTIAPEIVSIDPPEGTEYEAGEDIAMSAVVTDERGVASVSFRINDWVVTDDSEPFEGTLPAPVMSEAGEVEIQVEALDIFGNVTVATRTIFVEPHENSSSPVIDLPCPLDGSSVAPGVEVELFLSTADDERLERVRLLVDGSIVGSTSPVDQLGLEIVYQWTVPASAAAGTVFAVRVDARDFAGNEAIHEISLVVPDGTILVGDQPLDGAYNSQDLMLADGIFTVTGELNAGELVLGQRAELHGIAGELLHIAVDGILAVQCTSSVDATGLGFGETTGSGHPEGYGPEWVSPSSPDAGGSHGGSGLVWNGAGPAGDVYDSVYSPQLAGASGSCDSSDAGCHGGMPGGGVIQVNAGELVLEGSILARGAGGSGSVPAGAGGSISVTVDRVAGSGIIDVTGGVGGATTYFYRQAGAGGGGRIALSAAELDGFDPNVQARAWGGALEYESEDYGYAAPGTVFIKGPGHIFGNLVVDAGETADGADRSGPTTVLPTLGSGDVLVLESTPEGVWVTGESPFHPRWLGAWMQVLDGSGGVLGVFRVAQIDEAGRVLLEGAAGVESGTSYQGVYQFDDLEIRNGASLEAVDPVSAATTVLEGDVEVPASVVAASLVVKSGAIVRPVAGDRMSFKVLGTMTVESGAVLDVTGLGYGDETAPDHPEGYGPEWVNPSHPDAGGSHGGSGLVWNGAGPAGDVYDSVYSPQLAGASGACDFPDGGCSGGKPGGGAIRVDAGELVLDGSILARGAGGSGSVPAGAGGSITVTADRLSGSGIIDVSGGTGGATAYFFRQVGAGGGGRIALSAAELDGFDPAVQARAWGAALEYESEDYGYAAPGTVFVQGPESTFGRLVVDAGETVDGEDRVGPATVLPHLGAGGIVEVVVAEEGAWVAAEDPFLPRWLGAWLQVRDGSGGVLGVFRVAELDNGGRALLEDAVAIEAGTSYQGVYQFDEIEVRNGADLEATDPVEEWSVVLDGDVELPGDLEAGRVTIRSGATVHPASGSVLRISAAESLIIESGARLDVSGLGFSGGDGEHPQGSSPEWVTGSWPDAGGSHGGSGATATGNGPSGEPFDSVYFPQLPGGGGAADDDACCEGKPGGGVIHLSAENLVLDGEILARGESGSSNQAGGAGGTVLIRADILSGGGGIDASGGVNDADWHGDWRAGAGGGGRVGLLVGELSGFDLETQVTARGGTLIWKGDGYGHAAPGTVYSRTDSAPLGRLLVDNGETDGVDRQAAPAALSELGSGSVINLLPDEEGVWLQGAELFRPRWIGAWVILRDRSGEVLETAEVLDLDDDGRALLSADTVVSDAVSYEGIYRFDSVDIRNGSGLWSKDLVETGLLDVDGDLVLPPRIDAGDVIVRTGSVVMPALGSDFRLSALGALVIEADARLDVSGAGYSGGTTTEPSGQAPLGVNGSAPDAGGSHGGGGSQVEGPGPPGEVYGSVYRPQYGGGGGSFDGKPGASGGGTLELVAEDLVLDGQLLANGNTGGWDVAGGAGGSIWIRAGRLEGWGLISASGGSQMASTYGSTRAGAGGGGRVAVEVAEALVIDLDEQIQAFGGATYWNGEATGYAAPGTVFLRTFTDDFGDLSVDQGGTGGLAMPATRLPVLGEGIVGTAEADAEDPSAVWIEPQDPNALFDLGVTGMWVRVNGTEYRALEQTPERRKVLLEGAADAVQVGDAYKGVYKFDEVTVTGEATLEIQDAYEVAVFDVDPDSGLIIPDQELPEITITTPAASAEFASGETVAVTAEATDNDAVVNVTFALGDQSFVDETPPYEWSTPAPVVTEEQDVDIVVVAQDPTGNVGSATRSIHLRPLAPGDPPDVAIECPGPGVLLAPGTGVDLFVIATHDEGVEKVELLVGSDPNPVATDYDSPFVVRFEAPAAALEGDVFELKARARSFTGTQADAKLPVTIVDGVVFAADATIANGDLTHDGQSVVVSGGILTVDGPHSFRDLVVLDGATVTHSATDEISVGQLELALDRDIYVACGGAADATGRGYVGSDPRGYGYPNNTDEGAGAGVAGSHGGRGGAFDGTGRVYGSLFDPRDPGAGGGGAGSRAGGGVIRIAAQGNVVIDGRVAANGDSSAATGAFGAGGSVRLDGALLSGLGTIEARGGGTGSSHPGGSGGRIALLAGSIDSGLLSDTWATGGAGSTPALSGAAGTLYLRLDSRSLGELYIDNGGLDSTQLTELLAVGTGTVGAVITDGVTDSDADFLHDLSYLEVFFNGDQGALWAVSGHDHHGSSLTLDVSSNPLTAQAGDSYEGLLRLDRLVVAGQARALTRDALTVPAGAEVDAGAAWHESYVPTVTITSPGVGATFAAGSEIVFSADVDDLQGVQEVTFELGASSYTDTTAPYSWTLVAPPVASSTDLVGRAVATNLTGHQTDAELTVRIDPIVDPVAPVVTLDPCPNDGDWVVAGASVTLSFTVEDETLVEGYSILVDGVPEVEVSGLSQTQLATAFEWTVPVDATPGTSVVIRVEGRDFGANVASQELALVVPSGTVLTGDQVLDSSIDGLTLGLADGVFSVSGPLAPAGLVVLDGATLVPDGRSQLELDATGTIRVQCGGTISATATGYAGSATEGVAGEAPAHVAGSLKDGGGSHGGVGALHDRGGPVGDLYDSVYVPHLPGGGGSYEAGPGGSGGGVLTLAAGELVIDGVIEARGEKRGYDYLHRGGAGAGGSILVQAGTIRGSGLIDASGGDNHSYEWWAGSGGGGRVSLYAGLFDGFDPTTQARAWCGGIYNWNWSPWRYSAPGTVYVFETGMTYGELIVDGGTKTDGSARGGPDGELPELGSGSVLSYEVDGADAWVTGENELWPRWLGAWMALVDASDGELGGFQVVEVDTSGRALLSGAGTAAPSAVSFRGEYRFDAVSTLNDVQVWIPDGLVAPDLDVKAGEVRMPARVEADSVTVRSGAVISAGASSLEMVVAGAVTVETGALISATATGYAGSATEGVAGEAPAHVAGSLKDGGGSHGGVGALHDRGGPVGDLYDSVYVPHLPGGGGSYEAGPGGSGGGVLTLAAGELVIDGVIEARGEKRGYDYLHRGGAGAGGSILVQAGTIRGSGLIDASGGDNHSYDWWAGSGGGGRVSLYADLFDGFDPTTQARAWCGGIYSWNWSPWRYSAPGTVYVFETGMTYGELVIDGGTRSDGSVRGGPDGELPELGGGSVLSYEVDGADAWVTGENELWPRWLAAWMALVDDTGAELGGFQVAEIDASGRALLAGAATAAPTADTFRGEYRFDAVSTLNDVQVWIPDGLVAPDLEVKTGEVRMPARVEADSVTVRSGAVLSAGASSLEMVVAGAVTVETGALISATATGYAGSTTDGVAGESPAFVGGSLKDGGGSHGGAGALHDQAGPVGDPYDSVYVPELAGGGGSYEAGPGGSGGGVLRLTADELVLDGTIEARGEKRGYDYLHRGGAGAGGSILVQAGTIRGSGLIDASGGDNHSYEWWAGSGGGGRVALYSDVFDGFDPETQARAWGGGIFHWNWSPWRYSAPGTVYVFESGSAHGDVRVQQGDTQGLAVPVMIFPVVGTGTVGAAVPDTDVPEDLWIEPLDPEALFALGAVGTWIRVNGTDHAVLGQTPDRRQLLLEDAAGVVGVGDAYEGVYKFDTVTAKGGVTVEIDDVLEAGAIVTDGTSQVVTGN